MKSSQRSDYSGQGLALKLNSSVPYQYIELVRWPIFFNRTFTISAWIKPDLPALALTNFLAQSYKNASTFVLVIIDRRPRMRVYNTFLESKIQLKNFHWQYVTYTFFQDDLSMAIRIDGRLVAAGTGHPAYGNFEISQTTIGSDNGFNPYNGLIDQLSIAYLVKSREDVLDEATLVFYYTFEDDGEKNDSLFNDRSANNIRANGTHLKRVIGGRLEGQSSLSLYDPAFSYFQSSGFVLLVTYNFTYSYAFWLNIKDASSFMPLIYLVAKDEIPSANSTGNVCLSILVVRKSDVGKLFH